MSITTLTLQEMVNQSTVISLAELKQDTELLKEIQTHLHSINLYQYSPTDPDGLWGPKTEQGIKQFCQLHFNCIDTGLFGASLAKAILDTKSSSESNVSPSKKQIQTSSTLAEIINQHQVISLTQLKKETELVKEIQINLHRLNLYNYSQNDPDGLWGPKTEQGIEQFCQAVHLNCMETGLFGSSFAGALLNTKSVNQPGAYGIPLWWHGGNKVQLAEAIAKESHNQGISDRNQICYIMATIQHETADTFKPIAEYGGSHRRYAPYYGRGYVQLTWKYNYAKYGKILHQDFVDHPNEVMQPDISLFIVVNGMKDGIFTGKKLSDYIEGNRVDFVNARRIINGLDRAELIASYAREWQKTSLF